MSVNAQDLKQARPASLDSGEWGAFVLGETPPEPGEKIQVTARSGKSWEATVAAVVKTVEFGGEAGHLVDTGRRPRRDVGGEAPKRRGKRGPALGRCPKCGADISDQINETALKLLEQDARALDRAGL